MWLKTNYGETFHTKRLGYQLDAYYIPNFRDDKTDACDYFLVSPRGKYLLSFRIYEDGQMEKFDDSPTPYVVRRCTN